MTIKMRYKKAATSVAAAIYFPYIAQAGWIAQMPS